MPKNNVQVYTRYPLSSILTYNGTTAVHYLLGGAGIVLGYSSWIGYLIGLLYMVFAFAEMYLHMPLKVCPNCVYYKLDNSRCISGLNIVSRKIAREGNVKDFPDRAKGLLCPNNLYIASLVIPIIAMIPALALDFSYLVLAIMLIVVALLVFRFFVIFPKIACVHCRAKNVCPQAQSMGLGSI
jgi:amino acid transporter